MRSIVKFVATKKGMSTALALAIAKDSDLVSDSSDRLTRAIGLLLEQAIAAGEIRGDVSPEDLLRAIVGMCYTHDQPGWQKNVLRLVDIFVDGLRNQRGQTPNGDKSKKCHFDRTVIRNFNASRWRSRRKNTVCTPTTG